MQQMLMHFKNLGSNMAMANFLGNLDGKTGLFIRIKDEILKSR